jgi:hypothetical protein
MYTILSESWSAWLLLYCLQSSVGVLLHCQNLICSEIVTGRHVSLNSPYKHQSGRRASPPSMCDSFGTSFLSLLYDTPVFPQGPCGCSTTTTLPGLPPSMPGPICTTSDLINQAMGTSTYPVPSDSIGGAFFCAAAPGCGTPLFSPETNQSQICTGPNSTLPCFPAINVTTCLSSAPLQRAYPPGCDMQDFFGLVGNFSFATQVSAPTSYTPSNYKGGFGFYSELLTLSNLCGSPRSPPLPPTSGACTPH